MGIEFVNSTAPNKVQVENDSYKAMNAIITTQAKHNFANAGTETYAVKQANAALVDDSLNATRDLTNDPTNPAKQKAYYERAKQAAGQSSLGKKVAGIMLAFLGVCIVTASIVVITGLFWPFPAITLPIWAPYVALSAGALLTAGGVGLAYSGRTKGVAKKMYTFFNTAKKPLPEDSPTPNVGLKIHR